MTTTTTKRKTTSKKSTLQKIRHEAVYQRAEEKKSCWSYEMVSSSAEKGMFVGQAIYVKKTLLDALGNPFVIRVEIMAD